MEHGNADVRFGGENAGFQVGTSSGPISVEINPQRTEKTPSPCSTVPFRRDPDFTERGDLLERLRERLSIPTARVALVGLGGVGKSQLAIEYSYRLRERSRNTWVLWIHASSEGRFEQNIRDIAERVKINGRNQPGWLVILDNADDVSFLLKTSDDAAKSSYYECLPVCEHGSVLITSRNKNAALQLVEDRDIIEVSPMEEEDASTLLRKKLGGGEYKRHTSLGDSVGSYATGDDTSRRTNDYSKMSLLVHDKVDRWRDRAAANSIFSAWQMSFAYIHETRKSAADLLSLMSLCDRQAIPEILLQSKSGEQLGSNQDFEEDIDVLLDFAFITQIDSSTFEMHRLVQLATQQWLETRGELAQHTRKFIAQLHHAFPGERYANWPLCQTLLPHVKSALRFVPKGRQEAVVWTSLVENAAEYASRRGGALLWNQAMEMGKLCWKVRREELGEEDIATLRSMDLVAKYHIELGLFSNALEIAKECLELRRKTLGEESPDTLASIHRVSQCYARLEQFNRAVEMGERCYDLSRRTLGEEHLDTLESMSGLCWSYYRVGESSKAAEMGKRCYESRKRLLGEDHPDTLGSMGNLAAYYEAVGQTNEGAEMDERRYEVSKSKLGEDHPATLQSLNNLAVTRLRQQRFKESENMYRQALKASRRIRGQDHPDTLDVLANLAGALRWQGRNASALQLQEEAVEASTRALGSEHGCTIERVAQLERWRQAQSLIKPSYIKPEPDRTPRGKSSVDKPRLSLRRWLRRIRT